MSTDYNPLANADFDDSDDVGPKLACILLLDTSESMNIDGRIDSLNQALREFQQHLEKDDLAKFRVDVAVVTFGSTVEVVCDFVSAADFQAATLPAHGATPMGAAIHKALDMITERKDHYRSNGNPVYRPWIFMITDGSPTDEWQSAADRVKRSETDRSVVFWAVAVKGAELQTLSQISKRAPIKSSGLNFRELFVWLSSSISAASSGQPGAPKHIERPPEDMMV
jgi:uncharacterized protein YegL